jgi:serine/threonine protein phosphatase PrpC
MVTTMAHQMPIWKIGLNYAGRQSQGERPNQEDAYGVVPPEEMGDDNALLAVVADGMGGHAAGEIASELAVQAFVDGFFDADSIDDASRLWSGLEAANTEIGKMVQTRPDLSGMGTTLLAILIRDGTARWISVGDSPLYLFRDGSLQRLNRLHVEESTVGPDDLSPSRPGVLASAVIGERLYEVDDQAPVNLVLGDLLVAASDGLNTLSEAEMVRLFVDSPQQSAASHAEALLTAVEASGRPRQDNTTVLVMLQP